jgi:hypothetical protein
VKGIVVSMVVALTVGGAVMWFMTRSYGGGDAAAARTACLSVNAYAKEAGFDARKAALKATPVASPTPTPNLLELLNGARQPGGGGAAQMRRLETWCVGRGYGPTPTP